MGSLGLECKSEEVEAQRWMDRASRYLTEGRFESAIRLLEKTENVFPGCKSLPELMAVAHVSYASTWRACHCARPHTRKLPDWYHVLKVDERADFDTIKKRYRQLALLLHPDKNKHVNSEAAFKTITEAYACLSDKEKRDLFNLERRRSFCANCSLKAQLHAAGHTVHSAGHHNTAPRPVVKVRPPKQSSAHGTPKSTPRDRDSDNVQNFRERAKATVNSLEREWGSKTSKWMHQLASVRHRYWNLSNSPAPAKSRKPDPWTPAPKPHMRPDRRHTMNSTTSHNAMPQFDEVRRASTGGARNENLEEDLDLLLRNLRGERSKASPFSNEFVVHTRTPEAGHLARPLFVKRVSRSSSVDGKCSLNDAAPTYSMCMPRGRCVSKKDPFSRSTIPRKHSSSELKGQKFHTSKGGYYATPRRSSSLRFENLYSSTKREEDGVAQPESRSVGRTGSGSWTSKVKANPELFDDVFTTVSPSAFRIPIRRPTTGGYTGESFVLRTPSDAVGPKMAVPSKLPCDRSHKMVPKERRIPSPPTQKNMNQSNAGDGENNNEEAQPLRGTSRSENVCSFGMDPNGERGRDSQQEDMEQKQKTDAINGILERLRAEAKTVAASLDRLRENAAAENGTTRL